ncbi:aminotransferase class I/II-fold pyridoxal phosphate-dependent enzyme [Defluviimonas sp. WL0024]|uniref:Aminotransferase class I/II-fold pyridoxal phosphate-dependent enzyme n=1 Tax=Albidovulum salinarum TaxID=2984153 RepID=A0ABT2X8S9_9RHOB|nr:histidinol-phosphate transaminase [Defluviimonas sp. WL0024]MCU9849397.1 aminotransferase class I/II-fold pyridoxal phosphate-dependent enzyme [Defluviimonas sp. WL0024]
MIRAVPNVAAMAPYALADLGPAGSVSLAQNESAFGPSPMALKAGEAALAGAALYPDPDWSELRAAIAEVHGLDASRILCGAGSMELIGCLIRAFAGPGDEVLGTDHGYLFVATACLQAGAGYVKAAEQDLTVSVDALLAKITSRTRIAFLCNPGNPTGTRIPNAEILRLREALPAGVLLVVDQAYGEFDDQDPAPVFALAGRDDTVVLRTFSKAYALAGARAGWGLFPEEIGREARKLLNPNNVSAVSQAMAAAAMRDGAHMREFAAKTAAIRNAFAERLATAGYRIPPSHTNFVLIPFAGAEAARAADARLRAAGLLMRGMGGYGLGHCLRATVVAPEHMDRAAEILAAFREEGHDR